MPAGTEHLPAAARAALEDYLAALDAALPGIARGIYLTGSAALGDWQPGCSDLDILTVTERPVGDGELAALEALHAKIPERPYRDAVYIPARDIGTGAREGDPGPAAGQRYPSAVDGIFHRARYRPDPVLWATLHRHGLTVRGPEARTLGAEPGDAWLREWNLANLESYWRPWAANGRAVIAGHDPGEALPPGLVPWVPWAALGPGRLHATIATGQIISKTAAAGYTARLLPAYGELLARAKACRLGGDGERFTVADGRAACDLIDAVAADAAATAGRGARSGR